MRTSPENSFIGRASEIAELLADLPTSNSKSRGCVKTLSGEAGIGKSRLLTEIARIVESSGYRVLHSERLENSAAPPLFTWVLTLRSCLASYPDSDLLHDLGGGAGQIADLVPELRDRLNLTPKNADNNSTIARFQLYDCVSRFLLASAKRQPLVILLDNLHLADRSSLELLEYFSQQISGYPILVIAAYRTSGRDVDEPLQGTLQRLSLGSHFSQLTLDGFLRDEVATLLDTHSKNAPSALLVDSVYQQSDGNPLFVVEVARVLQRHSGQLPSPEVRFQFDLPNSLRDVILARLENLSAATCRLLRQASVLGREFDLRSWQALSKESGPKMLLQIQSAEDAGIIQADDPGRYRFHHALYRETLYAQLSRSDRNLMHVAAAEYFENKAASAGESLLPKLAYHYFEVCAVGYAEKAVDFNRQAGKLARQQRADSESAKFLEQALYAFDWQGTENYSVRFSLLLELGRALFRAGQTNSAVGPFLKASNLAVNEQDWLGLADALGEFQFVCGQTGYGYAPVSLHQTLLDHLPETYPKLRTRALASMADAQRLIGDKKLASKNAMQSMELAKTQLDPKLCLDCYCRANWALGCTPTNPENVEYRQSLAQEMLKIAKSQGSTEQTLLVMSSICFSLVDRSSAEELQNHLSSFRRMIKTDYHPHYMNLFAGFEISVHILQGRWDDALKCAINLRRQAYLQEAEGLVGGFGQQMFVIQKARGQLAAAAGIIQRIEADTDPDKLWLPGQILTHCEIGNWKRARELLSRLGDLDKMPRDDMYLVALIYLSEACIALNDRLRLIELYKFLKPFRAIMASVPGTALMGAVSGYMATIAVQLDKKVRARELFEEALHLNTRMAALPWLARTQTDYAQFLLRGNSRKDQVRARDLVASARKTATQLGLAPILKTLNQIQNGSDVEQLTKRERTVLGLIANGSSNKQIAGKLSVSLSTVATHVRNILRKLHVTNRTEATDFARRTALLD